MCNGDDQGLEERRITPSLSSAANSALAADSFSPSSCLNLEPMGGPAVVMKCRTSCDTAGKLLEALTTAVNKRSIAATSRRRHPGGALPPTAESTEDAACCDLPQVATCEARPSDPEGTFMPGLAEDGEDEYHEALGTAAAGETENEGPQVATCEAGPSDPEGTFTLGPAKEHSGDTVAANPDSEDTPTGTRVVQSTSRSAVGSTIRLKWRKKSIPKMGNCTAANKNTHEKQRPCNDKSSFFSPQQGLDRPAGPDSRGPVAGAAER
jgi:hypothetical protein